MLQAISGKSNFECSIKARPVMYMIGKQMFLNKKKFQNKTN
jgi:hypothetical protein